MNARQVRDGNNNDGFLCGVVEGFYGPPWSCEQRLDLFRRLREHKLDTFMYAPKDDTKHRAKWRQLYSEQEARELKVLIDEAKANGIDFYYSLAPGLDIVYSDGEELSVLVRKFDQLVSLGCEHFAILFDDIEPIINEKDRCVFKNYASAQVSVTNMIFEHLSRPKFLFCPTEYCESRAVPSVTQSIYLNTLGTGLHKGIDIMWSGSRVISRLITEEQIDRLTDVIRRRPVIWENLHANDYDMKRVFLGPYSGRSTRIIPKLKGVLTNPNCEYEANYVAIHTLAQWSKCTGDISLHNRCNPDLRFHDIDSRWASFEQISDSIYDPHRALAYAIKDWLPYWLEPRPLRSGLSLSQHQVQPRSDELASDQLAKQHDNNNEVVKEIEPEDSNVEMIPDETRSSANSVYTNRSDMDTSSPPSGHATNLIENTNSCDSYEMQDTQMIIKNGNAPPQSSSSQQKQHQSSSGIDYVTGSSKMLALNSTTDAAATAQLASDKIVNFEDLSLLVDLFYLPFEHGSLGYALLNDIRWLKDNHDMLRSAPPELRQQDGHGDEGGESTKQQQDAKMEPCGEETTTTTKTTPPPTDSQDTQRKPFLIWMDRAEKLTNLCACIDRLGLTLLSECRNKHLSAELYPYLNDLMFASINIKEYIKFLRYRTSTQDSFYLNVSCKYKEPVSSDEQEPWIHRGGLIGDVYRLLS